jgi:alanine racemase
LVLMPDALTHNLRALRAALPANRRIWAVAKANAYGHGIDLAVSAFAQADGLAVLDLQEASAARSLGWQKPVLMLEGIFESADLAQAVALDLDLVFHHPRQLDWWRASKVLRAPLAKGRHWFKFNTGMNRLGFRPDQMGTVLQACADHRAQGIALGFMTHYAQAEVTGGTASQLQAFELALSQVARAPEEAISTCNSAAVWSEISQDAEWVRPGLSLYGASPFLGPWASGQVVPPADHRVASAEALGLLAASELRTEIIAVQQVQPGAAVGYGGRWRAARPSRIGVVAAGYADGYPRTAPDGTPVLVGGVHCMLVGQVSMDMITVDLTDHPELDVGSPVELWGARLPVDRVAQACGTSAYELLTAVTPRVPRQR